LIRPADRALFSFMLEIETSKRAYARAHADGLSLSAIMRRFVVDYVRRERAARASEAAVQPEPKLTEGDRAAWKKARTLCDARAFGFPGKGKWPRKQKAR
jgi:hypothetical protein